MIIVQYKAVFYDNSYLDWSAEGIQRAVGYLANTALLKILKMYHKSDKSVSVNYFENILIQAMADKGICNIKEV